MAVSLTFIGSNCRLMIVMIKDKAIYSSFPSHAVRFLSRNLVLNHYKYTHTVCSIITERSFYH